MSARFLARVVWLTLGVLAWSGSTLVTGFDSSGSSLDSHYRYRLSRLFVIASRLNEKSQIRQKRLVDLDDPEAYIAEDHPSQGSIASKREAALWNNLDFRRIALTQKRYRRASAMNDLYDNYVIFHSYLTTFVNELGSKLKSDAPPELQYATIIPNILRTDDPDFDPFNKEKIEEKANIVLRFTSLLLSKLGQYVSDDNQDWFRNQVDVLTIWLGLVEVTIFSVNISDDIPTVEYLEAGIGGINTRFNTYHPIDVQKLQALLNVLNNNNGR